MLTKRGSFLAIIACVLAGSGLAVMIRLNASLGMAIGWLESSCLIHAVGALFAAALLWFCFDLKALKKISGTPKYLLLGGVLGTGIVFVSNWSVAHLGLVLTAGLFLGGNLLFAAVSDHFGFFNLPIFKISAKRLLGLVCALLGLVLISLHR